MRSSLPQRDARLRWAGTWTAVGLGLGLVAVGWEGLDGRGWMAGLAGGGALVTLWVGLGVLTGLGQWLWAAVLPASLRGWALRASLATWVLAWAAARLTRSLARGHSDGLVIGAVIAAVLVGAVGLLGWLGMPSPRPSPAPGARRPARWPLAVLVVASTWSVAAIAWAAGRPRPLRLGPTHPVLGWVDAWTDPDFDGYGRLVGPRDCAPWDSRRHPRAEEVPGNGIDENCDRSDAPPRTRGR